MSKKLLKNLLVQFGRLIPDALYLRIVYRLRMGEPLNLKDPKTYTEKLQWLKLHDYRPEYTAMVDFSTSTSNVSTFSILVLLKPYNADREVFSIYGNNQDR